MSNLSNGSFDGKLSLAAAMREGYSLDLEADGCGFVYSPRGARYRVLAFECSCPDALHRGGGTYHGHCKHALLTAQVRPCGHCDGTMELGGADAAPSSSLHGGNTA